jgi:predicted  nucleic acid-binding Zn-ribbon protein
MNDEIRVLVELSHADLECSRLHARTEAIPRELEKHEAELVIHRRALEEQEGRREDLHRERRMMEHDADGARQRRRDLELQQFRIKNNVEYQAMLREIGDLNHRADELETQALKLLEDENLIQQEIDRLNELVAQEERRLSGVRERLTAELAGFSRQLDAARGGRDSLVVRLSPALRNRYERIRRSKGDMAVVGVEGGACGGCGYQLPPQRLVELQKQERVIVCEGCGRILVWAQ